MGLFGHFNRWSQVPQWLFTSIELPHKHMTLMVRLLLIYVPFTRIIP